jgi:putative endonuclease
MFTVYAIHNRLSDKIYIGQTEDLSRRILEHNDGIFQTSYTARFPGEWVLIFSQEFETRPEALRREKQLKSYRGREFIRSCRDSSVGRASL